MANTTRATAFDEQKALAELERMRLEIDNAHRRRVELEEAFDEFIRGFKSPATGARSIDPAPRPVSTRVEMPRAVVEPAAPISRPVSHAPLPSSPAIPQALVDRRPPAAAGRASAWNLRAIRARDVGIAGAGLAVLAGVLVVRGLRNAPPETTESPTTTAAPANVGVAAPPATTAAAPPIAPAPAVPASGLAAQLTATRAVWVRVTVDGERALEREIPAGTVLPFRAERTLAFRIGDAGAVRLVVNGREAGPLGPDGQIATRTFTAPVR